MSSAQPDKEDISGLETVDDAERNPRVFPLWRYVCWIVFVAGISVVLSVVQENPQPDHEGFRLLLQGVIGAALICLAFNTYAAAEAFGKRRDAIFKWVSGAVEFLEAHRNESGTGNNRFPPGPQNPDEIRKGAFVWRHIHYSEHRQYYIILPFGDYRPYPFRTSKGEAHSGHNLQDYQDLIEKEVQKARGTLPGWLLRWE